MTDPLLGDVDPVSRLRHTVEDEQMRMQTELAAANARTPGDWFDIFTTIGFSMVKRELERLGRTDPQDFDRTVAEHRPFYAKVRSILEKHGLPLTEEVEIEGPDIEYDLFNMPHNITWPRGVWLELHWPESKGQMLRFEGRAASVALEFIQWWDGFHQVAMKMGGKDSTGKQRLVDPNSPEYLRYVTGKRKAQDG